MLRLELLGFERAKTLADANELLTKHKLPLPELEDYFARVLKATHLPWPPGEDIVEVNATYDEEEGVLVIEARSSDGRRYRSRCVEAGANTYCFPDPS